MKVYTMTQEQFDKMIEQIHDSPPLMMIGGTLPRSPQERANDAWRALGREMGFRWDTALPYGSNKLMFEAQPLEFEE